MNRRVEKQLKKTQGLVRYSVRADFPHKQFWTFTIWKDKKFVQSFVQVEPHADAVRKFKDWAGEGAAFVEWNSTNSAIDWATATQKLNAPTFYYKA
jgi:heme-degrading monooxygenase HmoA